MKLFIQACVLACAIAAPARAQPVPISPHLFAINYWYYDYAGNIDNFNAKKAEVQAAGIRLVRLGGNAPNRRLALSDLPAFDLAIERVNSIGATPLMQLPINLAPADTAAWIAHFRARGIRYWAIGNEPDPSNNFYEWYKGTAAGGTIKRENGNTYAEFRAKFVALARAVKQADPAAIVVGPDFRQWWGATGATEPLASYYPDFIADVGALTEGGVPLLDIFAYHFYGYHSEAENRRRTDLVQSYLAEVNKVRSSALRLAVGEVNATTSNAAPTQPWAFDAGQFLVIMTKNAARHGGEFVAPWSVYESGGSRGTTDFSTFHSNGSPRSTMVHFSLLAQHRRAMLMSGDMDNPAQANSLVEFGMTGADGATLMLMNTSTTARSYAVRMDGQYPARAADARFRFASGAGTAAEWGGSIPAKTTLMWTLGADGRRLKEFAYDKAMAEMAASDPAAAPVVRDLTVHAAVDGSSGVIVLGASSAQPRKLLEFHVDGVLAGSAAAAPFSVALDSASLANGTHSLVVKAVDANDNVDTSEPLSFFVNNPVDVSARVAAVRSALVFNRAAQTFNGRLTLTATGGAPIDGPLQIRLAGLPAGVVLANASGMHGGLPVIDVDAALVPGVPVSVPLMFSNPGKVAIGYTPHIYSGSAQGATP